MTDLNREDVREQTLPLILLNDAANIVQRGLEKRLSHVALGVAQQRILTAVYFGRTD